MIDPKSNEFKQKKKKSQSYRISLGIGKKKGDCIDIETNNTFWKLA